MPLDFSKPLQVYKWLHYLKDNDRYGYIIKPNLNLPQRSLGFSLKSNAKGLRGLIPNKPTIAIIGTSYAMGFGVNNNKNWYEVSGLQHHSLNIGLPVGFREWKYLFEDNTQHTEKIALVIYHCNFFGHEEIYSRWRSSKATVSETFHWKKTFLSAAKLQFSKKFKENRKQRFKIVQWNKTKVSVNTNYAYSTIGDNPNALSEIIPLLDKFEKIIVLRVMCKEEVLGRKGITPDLFDISSLHEKNWNVFSKKMQEIFKNISIGEWEPNRPEFYLSYDSHLSEEGNAALAEQVKKILNKNQVYVI